jgi:N-methylhydantoinase A
VYALLEDMQARMHGGASGLHTTDIARQLDLSRFVVPRVAAVLSACGMLATDLRFEVAHAYRRHESARRRRGQAALRGDRGGGRGPAACLLRIGGSGAGFDGPARMTRSVDMRYGEQVFETAVPLDGVDWEAADPLPQIVERFHRRHEELYTYPLPDQETVLVNARVTVAGLLSALPQEPHLPETPPTTPRSERRIYLNDWVTTRFTISTRWRQRKPSRVRPS